MTKQERFNALMDALKALDEAYKYRYSDSEKAYNLVMDADEHIRSVLYADWGDWGDMSNPKIVKLWDKYDEQKEGLK